jgi:hypothetical protein
MNPTNVFGLRILARFGFGNVLRLILVVLWLGILAGTVGVSRDDLLHPADFGQDSSNYVAAGERALSGSSSLYQLAPGDRPVPDEQPPDWSAPILSPPPVATVWAALDWAPDVVRFHALWALGAGATCWLVLHLIRRLPLVVLLPVMYLFAGNLSGMAWSGNVNALIAPGLAVVWHLATSARMRHAAVYAGAIAAASALVKLGPAFVGLWLLSQGQRRAVVAAIATAVVAGAVTLILVGPADFIAYVDVVRSTAGMPSRWSIPGISAALGVPAEYGSLLLLMALGAAALAIIAFRRQPRVTFAVAVLAAVMATTVVRPDTFVVAVAALAPWVSAEDTSQRSPRRPSAHAINAAIAALVATTGVVAAIATGGLATSSMTLTNLRPEPVVVRFSVPFQGATFGYRVEAGATGMAWSDQTGRITAPVFVMTGDCRLLFRHLPQEGSMTLVIGPDVVDDRVAQDSPAGGPFLAYVPDCAAEARAEIARAP